MLLPVDSLLEEGCGGLAIGELIADGMGKQTQRRALVRGFDAVRATTVTRDDMTTT